MKITKERLRTIIKEEVRRAVNEQSRYSSLDTYFDSRRPESPAPVKDIDIYDKMISMGYGVVGSVQSRRGPKNHGRYTSNNGVIGIIPPGKTRGHQYFPRYQGSGNLGEVLELVRSLGYREEGMPLRSARPEVLYRMASSV